MTPDPSAFATSVASARVGLGLMTIDSNNIWVAVTTRFPAATLSNHHFLVPSDRFYRNFYTQITNTSHHIPSEMQV
jgi:hypothetical protein